jgi:hypothetical protein
MERYDPILKFLNTNMLLKLIFISDQFAYYILSKKKYWNFIEIYNLKNKNNILDFIKQINNSPITFKIVSSCKIRINHYDLNFSKLKHLDLSNSKISFASLMFILYNSKLEKLYLKRINLYKYFKHITNSQKETLKELDISSFRKYWHDSHMLDISTINLLTNLTLLKINNLTFSYQTFFKILELPNLEILEMANCYFKHNWKYCVCQDLHEIIPYLNKLKVLKISDDIFCSKSTQIIYEKLENKLIMV